MKRDGVGQRRIVAARGEVDLATVSDLQWRLHDAASPGDADVVVDLTEVTFLDSTGLAAFVSTHKRLAAAGRTLILRNPRANVRRVLEITLLDTVMPIEEPDRPDLTEAASKTTTSRPAPICFRARTDHGANIGTREARGTGKRQDDQIPRVGGKRERAPGEGLSRPGRKDGGRGMPGA